MLGSWCDKYPCDDSDTEQSRSCTLWKKPLNINIGPTT